MQDESLGYRIDQNDLGRTLVVTGGWTAEAARVLDRGDVDGLTLNYALGFSEPTLDFLDGWPIRRLNILARDLTDLEPIARLRETLEELSVQAAPEASLDLGDAPRLRAVAGEWELIRWQLRLLDSLERLITWRFDETTLLPLSEYEQLQHLTIKEPGKLESLLGAENLSSLRHLELISAPRLTDISAIAGLVDLEELSIQDARGLVTLEQVSQLTNLWHLGIADCGDVESLAPLVGLTRLRSLYAWGTTRVVDGDLSPLLGLSALTDFRMRSRRQYSPSVEEVKAHLAILDLSRIAT